METVNKAFEVSITHKEARQKTINCLNNLINILESGVMPSKGGIIFKERVNETGDIIYSFNSDIEFTVLNRIYEKSN